MGLLSKTRERDVENKHRVLREKPTQSIAQEAGTYIERSALTSQIHRRWRAGDVYAPHDLSGIEMAKWKKRGKVTRDVFDVVAFDPITMGSYKVSFVLNRERMMGW